VIILSTDPAIGVDLKLQNDGDLGATSTGDLDLAGDNKSIDNLVQSVRLRIITTLGTNYFSDGFGSNIRQYVDEPLTDDLQKQIRTEVQDTVLRDSRVQAISNISISEGSNSWVLSFAITAVNGETQSGSVTIGG
jgi:phage baseplate assembly protein W